MNDESTVKQGSRKSQNDVDKNPNTESNEEKVEGNKNPSIEIKHRGAYVVNATALGRIEDILRKAAGEEGGIKEEVHVITSGEPSKLYERVEEACEHRNSKGKPITTIAIGVVGKEAEGAIGLDNTGVEECYALYVGASASSVDVLSRLAGEMEDEFKNMRCWYSAGRKMVDSFIAFLNRGGKFTDWIMNIYIVGYFCLVTVLIVLSGIQANLAREDSKQAMRNLEEVEASNQELEKVIVEHGAQLSARLEDTPGAWEVIFNLIVTVAFWLFVGWFGLMLLTYLFPRIVFEIGEGKLREEHRRRMRWYVIGSVLFCGVGLRLISAWLVA